MPVFVAVAIDSADQFHLVHATAPDCEPLRLRIANDLGGFQRLLDQLRQHFGDLPLRFALENPALLIARFLLHAGHAVYALNPRSVAAMRTALASSGKKDDPLDAECLALLLRHRMEDLVPIHTGSADCALLAGWVRQRVDVVEEKTRVLNQLTAVLKAYYPRALELFAKLEQPLTLAFLQAFPTPTALAQAPEAEWQALFVGQRYPRPRNVASLWQRAQAPQVPVSAVDESLGARQLGRLVSLLEVLLAELKALEAEIARCFAALPAAKTFRSLPGAADVLAPALCALLGDDPARWRDWHHLAQIAGTVPVTQRSGNCRAVNMRYHCDHRARRTLHLFAQSSVRACAWAREFYRQQRAQGKGHATALRNLATKWLRILFRLWQEGTTYDEALYLKNRGQRGGEGGPAPLPTGPQTKRSRTGGGRTPAMSSAGAGPASGEAAAGANG